MKKNLLVSFSGGETSAFMAQWIKYHLQDKVYENVKYVFANTGLENDETLNFIQECDEHFKYNIEWVEASVFQFERKGSGYWTTNFENAKRKGEPFEAVIQKYGIPNQAFPHCTRELKQNPIKAWAKDYFEGEEYDTAIGIRIDEIDRMNAKWKENNFIYPLIHRHMIPATKPMVNFYWKNMPFRLQLKGYQGNCATCWKKADKKLFQIYKENPTAYDFMARMEKKYPRVGAEFNKEAEIYYLLNGKYRCTGNYNIGDNIYQYEGTEDEEILGVVETIEKMIEYPKDRVFFRQHRSANDIMIQADKWKGAVVDDSQETPMPSLFDEQDIDLIGGESCEVFSECGS
jgi:Phosphoadenosine phosphosulfate reductase family